MKFEDIIQDLESLANPEDIAGMARFGIKSNKAYGVRMPELTRIAREARYDHQLAEELWVHGYTETRILAAMIDDPKLVTPEQMERWVGDFNSWDVCDQCCMKLFRKTPYAYQKIDEWNHQDMEFVKRAAFALIATLAVHDHQADDQKFIDMLPLIKEASTDERNFVKKGVNWALRQIGKRNQKLNREALKAAREMENMDSKSARWIAKDAIRELKSEKIQLRLRKKAHKT